MMTNTDRQILTSRKLRETLNLNDKEMFENYACHLTMTGKGRHEAFTETQNACELHALAVVARSGVQEYAIDLYERGFNVFPIPSAYDWNLRGETKKTPYKLEPLFRNRMHYVKDCQCLTCYRYNFITLFEDSNIAVMCGATSGNLLSVDCDSQEAFKKMGDELTRRGLVFWAFTSHRGGQYLLRVIEGEAANIPQEKSKFEDVQIWGSRHLIVVPPSIHPKGTVYKWLSPEPLNMLPRETLQAVSIDSLEWLGATLKKYRKSQNEDDVNGLPEYAKNLSHASRHTLRYGAKQGGRNSALTALAADLVGIGLIESEVEAALQTAADNCTPPYEDRDHNILPILEWAFSQDRKPSRTYQTKVKSCVKDWQRAQKFESAFHWNNLFSDGQGVYARRVYRACIERAKLDTRNKCFRASAREIATLANMHHETVSKYLHLLVDENILDHWDTEKSGAKVYKFMFDALQWDEQANTFKAVQYSNIDILLYGDERTENMPQTDAERDAFHGLGVYAFLIWRDLLVRPAKSAYQIAKRLNLPEKTIRATISRLVLAGLASYSQSEGVYYGNALTDAQLGVKAADRGTQGHTNDKRAQYVKEREKYVNRVIGEVKAWYKKKSAELLRPLSSHFVIQSLTEKE